MGTAETQIINLTRLDDGIVVGRERNPDLSRTAERVAEALAATWELAGRKPCPALWDMSGMPRPRPESWKLFIHRVPEVFAALAIVADQESIAVLGAFPMARDNLLVPVRVFEDESEAVEWSAVSEHTSEPHNKTLSLAKPNS